MKIEDRREIALLLCVAVGVGMPSFSLGLIVQDHFGQPRCTDEHDAHSHVQGGDAEPIAGGGIDRLPNGVDGSNSTSRERLVIGVDFGEHQGSGGDHSGKTKNGCGSSAERDGCEVLSDSQTDLRLVDGESHQERNERAADGSNDRNPLHMSVSGRCGGWRLTSYRWAGAHLASLP